MNNLNRFLAHLWRGGRYSFFCTDNISIWFEVNDMLNRELTILTPDNSTGVFFGVNPCYQIPPRSKRGSTDRHYIRSQIEYLAAVNCLYGELDGGRSLDDLLSVQPAPSVVIQSSTMKFHAYWLLRDTVLITDDNREYLKHIQANWVKYIGSDEDSKNLNRVLRLPGTLNRKPQYAPDFPMVEFVYTNFDQLYSIDELADLLPAYVPRENTAKSGDYTDYDVLKARQALNRLADWRCEDRNSWFLVLCSLHSLGEIGEELARDWSQQSSKYDEKDFDKVWSSITDKSNGITLGSLFKWSREDRRGY